MDRYIDFANIQDLEIVPVLNKIDLPTSNPEKARKEMSQTFDIEEAPLLISAKTGQGVSKVLDSIIDTTSPPAGKRELPFRGLLFDSWYDAYLGVVCMISIGDGCMIKGQKV